MSMCCACGFEKNPTDLGGAVTRSWQLTLERWRDAGVLDTDIVERIQNFEQANQRPGRGAPGSRPFFWTLTWDSPNLNYPLAPFGCCSDFPRLLDSVRERSCPSWFTSSDFLRALRGLSSRSEPTLSEVEGRSKAFLCVLRPLRALCVLRSSRQPRSQTNRNQHRPAM